MDVIIVPLTKKAREFFDEEKGVVSISVYPFLTTLKEKEADGMKPVPLERGKDFREYLLVEVE